MIVGTYVDGRPLTYDESNGSFAVGDVPVTTDLVRAYRQAGQLEWLSPEIGVWFEGSFPALPTTAPGQPPSRVRKKRTGLIIAIATIVLACVLAPMGFSLISTVLLTGNTPAYTTVPKVVTDSSLIGERVKVGGTVVGGSWDKQTSPMVFTIRDEADAAGSGPTIKVIYSGPAPSAFGDGTVAIVTGILGSDGTVTATDMITKCPSKWESADPMPMADLLAKGDTVVGKPVRTTGYVKAGTISDKPAAERFVVTERVDGTGGSAVVAYSGTLPSGMTDGAQVVLSGKFDSLDRFTATGVELAQTR